MMMNDKQPEATPQNGSSPGKTPPTVVPQKTPMFQAMNAERYRRQDLIRQIQSTTGRPLICYVSGPSTYIDRDDTLGFVDLLYNVSRDQDLDFLLHTSGGDIDAAEKLISLVRAAVGAACLRIIVPDSAKSAGTLMALGADKLIMSDTSELGPIDPQIILSDGSGNRIRYSIQSYIDAYDEHAERLQKNPNDAVAQTMLAKIEPARVKLFAAARARAQKFAEDQLRQGMFKRVGTGNFTDVAAKLMDTKTWLSHGQMIGHADAAQIGLIVEYADPMGNEWRTLWHLYCLQRLAVKDRQKLFESDYASICFEGPSS